MVCGLFSTGLGAYFDHLCLTGPNLNRWLLGEACDATNALNGNIRGNGVRPAAFVAAAAFTAQYTNAVMNPDFIPDYDFMRGGPYRRVDVHNRTYWANGWRTVAPYLFDPMSMSGLFLYWPDLWGISAIGGAFEIAVELGRDRHGGKISVFIGAGDSEYRTRIRSTHPHRKICYAISLLTAVRQYAEYDGCIRLRWQEFVRPLSSDSSFADVVSTWPTNQPTTTTFTCTGRVLFDHTTETKASLVPRLSELMATEKNSSLSSRNINIVSLAASDFRSHPAAARLSCRSSRLRSIG